jgi:hypothetical protein
VNNAGPSLESADGAIGDTKYRLGTGVIPPAPDGLPQRGLGLKKAVGGIALEADRARRPWSVLGP